MTEPALLVLIGTKAQFIKTAPILKELDLRGIPYRLVYTGQHNETFALLESAFGTRPPDDILVPGVEAATHGRFLAWCFRYWRAALARIRAGDWQSIRLGLVHGDTASTLFGAMAVRFAGAGVAHVEAGLRSPRLLEPFPEEMIRRLVSRVSTLHFAPDESAVANLSHVAGDVIDTRGNTLRDALSMSLRMIGTLPAEGGDGGYAVVSIHRSENMSRDSVFELLMEEIQEAATRIPVKFVLHPVTREKLHASGWFRRLGKQPQVELLQRMDYPEFVRLLLGSRFLMTDGGSNQEEAAMLGLPTLLLRRATERNDGIGDNVVLSGLRRDFIRQFVASHAQARWPIRLLSGGSPTARLVDGLQESLGPARSGER